MASLKRATSDSKSGLAVGKAAVVRVSRRVGKIMEGRMVLDGSAAHTDLQRIVERRA